MHIIVGREKPFLPCKKPTREIHGDGSVSAQVHPGGSHVSYSPRHPRTAK